MSDEAEHELWFRKVGNTLVKWAEELSKRVGPDEAGRLLFAAGVAQKSHVRGVPGTADFLRELADHLDAERAH